MFVISERRGCPAIKVRLFFTEIIFCWYEEVPTNTCVDIIFCNFSKGHVARLKERLPQRKMDKASFAPGGCSRPSSCPPEPNASATASLLHQCQSEQMKLNNGNWQETLLKEGSHEVDSWGPGLILTQKCCRENFHLFFLADMLQPGQDLLFPQWSKAKPWCM